MDTNRLKQFCTIVETGSLTEAAKLLHITHSGLSKSMKLLQQELKRRLLRPHGRGLQITEDGKDVYRKAKEFLTHEQKLFDKQKIYDAHNLLKIGTVEIFLLCIARQMKQTFVGHTITLLDLDPGNIEYLVANKQLDFGITYVPFPTRHIEFIEIGKYRLGCYHLKNTFEKTKLENLPFVVPAKSLSNNTLGIKERDGWLDSIYPRVHRYSVNLLATAIELTLQGLCAMYIPKFVAHHINTSRKANDKLVEYPLSVQKNFHSVYVVRHNERTQEERFNQICKMVKSIITLGSK